MKKLITLLLFALSFISIYSQDIEDEFNRDTARVEQMVRDTLDKYDYSTWGMHAANTVSEVEYDKLLNKYYKLLQNKLDENGKKALKEAQLSWINFRDTDRKLITELYKNTYNEMGGGTMWSVIYGDFHAQLTRERVFVLYKYLTADVF